jgi:zinc transport system ATP-binding protein
MPPAIELRKVSFAYSRFGPTLAAVNLEVAEGEFLAIAGPNGGGKTTLLKLVLGLLEPASGSISLFGEPVAQVLRRGWVSYLPQRARVGVAAPVTVRELVVSGRARLERPFGLLSRAGRAKVQEAIEEVGLGGQADQPVASLSGGQQQRAFLARMLAAEARLLALDEPTTGVDSDSQERLAELLEVLNERHRVAILYVSHEFGAVEKHLDRLVLVRGGIVYDGPVAGLPPYWHDPSHDHARPAGPGSAPHEHGFRGHEGEA